MSWRDRKDKKEKDEFPFDIFNDRSFFGNDLFERFFNEMSKMMENIDEDNPNIQVKKFGPYVWGYSMSIGPDGKPIVKQFSNVDQEINQPELNESSSEPLIDVFIEDKTVKVIAEMPGVNKEDIQVTATESKIKILADSDIKHYNTEKELNVKIKPKTAKSTYNNGILELIFEREEPSNEEEFEVDIS